MPAAMRIDVPTAMLVTSLLTFGVGLSLAFAVSRYPADLRGTMRVWIGGLFLQALALFAPAVLTGTPNAWLMVASNVIYALAYAEMGRAVDLFAGSRPGWLRLLLVGMVGVVSFAFSVVWPQVGWRIVGDALPIAALQLLVARAILGERPRLRPADVLTGALFFACAVLALTRGVVEFLGPHLIAPDWRNAMNDIVYVFSAILPMLGTIGFMLMCVDRLNDDLTRLAMVDPLTGVYNRRTLAGLAETAIGKSLREGQPLSLLAIDVDHFKRINDEFGHDSGDEALRHLVAFIEEALHPEQILCRIGGEEFAILLPGADEGDACLTAERVRRHIAASSFSVRGHTFHLRVSIGVATLDGVACDLATLLRDADRALYAAKRAGRDRIAAKSSLEQSAAPPRRTAATP